MTDQPTTVYLVESSDETRALVAGFLERSGRIGVVGTAADPLRAVGPIRESKPDVVIVDRFPGSELLSGDHRVVMHATTVPDRTAMELQRAGVDAIVFKEVGMLDELIDTVLRVAGKASPARPIRTTGRMTG